MYRAVVLASEMYTHIWSQIDGSGQLSSRDLTRGTRTNTLTAIRNMNKVTESIGDRVGGYNFLPALFTFGSRRKQCPLHSVNSESSFFDCAGSDAVVKTGRRVSCRRSNTSQTTQPESLTGQSVRRGRVRCQSLFIARERRRCEPGSNSVIVTNALTSVEGHVLRLAAMDACGRFLSAVRQSAPSGTSHRGVPRPGLRLLVTGSIHYTIKIASAVSRRRRKSKIVHAQRPDQIPPRAFHASTTSPLPRWERARVRVTPQGPSFPRRREPREKQSTPINIPSPSMGALHN